MEAFLSRAFLEAKHRAELLSETIDSKKSLLELSPSIKEIQRRLRSISDDSLEYAEQCKTAGSRQALTAERTLLPSYVREYHRLSRDLSVIEEQFVGHVVRFHDPDLHLTRTAAKLWAELNLPGDPPVVVGSTSNYYNTFPTLNIAFTPFSASSSFLTIPDLLHEFGHLLHRRYLPLFGSRTAAAINAYRDQLRAKFQQIRQPVNASLVVNIEGIWKKRWAEEVACDSLAVLVLGSAYAWCNLLLCIKNAAVTEFGSHPADMSRTEHLLRVLRRQGFDDDANQIRIVWEAYLKNISTAKPPHYADFHSDELFLAVLEDVEQTVQQIPMANNGSLVREIQNAWQNFLTA